MTKYLLTCRPVFSKKLVEEVNPLSYKELFPGILLIDKKES